MITFGDKRVYVAGDTENIPDMKKLKEIAELIAAEIEAAKLKTVGEAIRFMTQKIETRR